MTMHYPPRRPTMMIMNIVVIGHRRSTGYEVTNPRQRPFNTPDYCEALMMLKMDGVLRVPSREVEKIQRHVDALFAPKVRTEETMWTRYGR